MTKLPSIQVVYKGLVGRIVEQIWVHALLKELSLHTTSLLILCGDNLGAYFFASNWAFTFTYNMWKLELLLWSRSC